MSVVTQDSRAAQMKTCLTQLLLLKGDLSRLAREPGMGLTGQLAIECLARRAQDLDDNLNIYVSTREDQEKDTTNAS